LSGLGNRLTSKMSHIPGKPAIIILAAGLGTRMKSNKAKVLHEILGKPMVTHVVETAQKVAGNDIILVIGHQAEKVRQIVSATHQVLFTVQKEQSGTGHAVMCALSDIPDHARQVIILCGDVPLLTADTILRFLDDHVNANRDLTLLAVEIDNPAGYGRVLIDEHRHVTGIVEEADATEQQKKIKTINTGIYCVKKEFLSESLRKITPDNVQGEFYLTDIVEIGCKEGKVVGMVVGSDYQEFTGINTVQDLIRVESIMRNR
jgi:UDP-N-acetylglucosamine diphosphorylase/glucosamine-1-phosphate N-acetyltransferase